MGVYATPAEVAAELARFPDLSLPADLEPLISAASRAVDQRLGPLEPHVATGLKLDPALLEADQKAALVRAVAVAVGHLSLLDAEDALGVDDFAPEALRPMRGAGLATRVDEALAGYGLISRSLTVATAPDDELSA